MKRLLDIILVTICMVQFSVAIGQTLCSSPVALNIGTTQCGTNNNAGSFPDGGGAPTNPCNGLYNDGEYWFSFTGTGMPLSLAVTGLTATYSGLYVLSACPGSSPTCVASYSSGGSTANFNVTTPALTLGQVYYIVMSNWSTPYSTAFCITSSIATPPANDDPCSATPITVGASCVYATYTNANATATAGPPAPGCASYSGGDVWFSVTVPASGSINFDSNTGVITDGGMAIYSGTCGSLSLLACDDDGSANGAMSAINLTGQTPGATLWIRFWEFGNNNNGTFQLCATDPGGGGGGAPANDNPCSATPLAVNASCVYTASTNAGATATAGVPAPGCASYSGGDVWFSVTVPATGNINFNSNTGVITDGGMAIYSGTCGSLSLLQCDDDGSTNGLMSAISLTGQTPGATLWVRFWEYGNDNNGSFSICASEGAATGPCGSIYNDNCANPAILTQGGGPFTGNTSTTFTADLPGNITTEFCGSIENNSWFVFTASATTESFNFTSISNCTWGDGVQAEVYSFSTDGSGCCTAFSSVSNCYNPASTAGGTVTASGLTIGNSYLLMVDGWAGDDCDFTISGWSVSGILPISLTTFEGHASLNENVLEWTTKSEQNNSHFIVEESRDGLLFHSIGTVYGHGNSNNEVNYSFSDRDVNAFELSYYRLKQIDFDGNATTHRTIYIDRNPIQFSIYPNPSESELTITVGNIIETTTFQVEFIDISGRIVKEFVTVNNGVFNTTQFSNLNSGVYFIRISDANQNVLHLSKVIRK
jgi:hypothetical protein